MIKNVIFDFGQVIVRFEPAYIVGQFVTDPDDATLLERVMFDRAYWDRLDEGTLGDEEFLSACRGQLPVRLHERMETIYWNWIYHIPEIEGMGDLVREVKAKPGVKAYLLSNISTYFASHSHEFPILGEFDWCLFSALYRLRKPNPAIFELLCHRCDIRPEESIFIDDNEDNVQAARSLGIHTYHFDGNVKALRDYLLTLL